MLVRLVGVEYGGEVAKALAAAQLPGHKCEQLMSTCEMLCMKVPVTFFDQPSEFVMVKKSGKLCEYVFVFVHL